MSEADEAVRHIIGTYLIEQDIRHRLILDSLSTEQLKVAAGVFCQSMAFGQERDPARPIAEASGGFAATCARCAILAGYSADGVGT
jgi:hypothetical protein